MIKIFHPRGVKELIWKAGRTTEKISFKRSIKKHPTQGIRAYKIAQIKGIKKVQALGKRHGVEGLGASLKGPKIKSRWRPQHFDDPNLAYRDMPQIVGRASAEAKQKMHGWGFRPKSKGYYKITERIKDPKTGIFAATRIRKKPQYTKHKNLSSWLKSGRKTFED